MTSSEYLNLRKQITDEYEQNLAALERVYGLFGEPESLQSMVGGLAPRAMDVVNQPVKASRSSNGHTSVAQRIREAANNLHRANRPISTSAVAKELGIKSDTVGTYFQDMKRRGQIKLVTAGGPGVAAIYRGTKALERSVK